MMTVRTEIKPSSIEGVGIFASEFIPKGTIIWRMDSRFDMNYTAEQLDNLHLAMKEFIFRYGYPHMSAPHLTVLELDNGRFMNHSTSPNTDFTRPDVGIAIEDIHDGDEITCNYFEFDKTFIGFHDQASSSPRETA